MPLLPYVIVIDVNVWCNHFANKLGRVTFQNLIYRQQVSGVHSNIVPKTSMEVDGLGFTKALFQECCVVQCNRSNIARNPTIKRKRLIPMSCQYLLLLCDEVRPQRPRDVDVIFDVTCPLTAVPAEWK